MFTPSKMLLCVVGGAVLSACVAIPALAEGSVPAPVMGMNATLIHLSPQVVPAPEGIPSRGLRVNRVTPGTPARRLGLEPGDIVVSVDSMRFTTYAGFQHALRCSGQRPSFIIVNVRTGHLVRRATELPHDQPENCEPMPPDSYGMSIDLRSDMER